VLSKKGDPMKFITFEDDTGIIETTFFPRVYHQFCNVLDYGRPYLISGKVEENWGALTLTVDGAMLIIGPGQMPIPARPGLRQ